MNTQKIKIGLLVLGTIASGIGGLLFAASFAVDELQSWPRALWEAHLIPLFGLVLGGSIGCMEKKFQRWFYTMLAFIAFPLVLGFAWALSSVPPAMFWVCVLGIFMWVLTQTVLAADLMMIMMRREP